jgi:acetylornithine deacetylase/succinyl-diaminopimelate desuccinylase-like protein
VTAAKAAPPYKGVTTGPYVAAAKRAMKFAFGKDPVTVREGGTIGAILSMEQILKCPIVFMGLSLPEHGYHAPNENYDWGQAGGGIVAFAKFVEEAAAQ